MRVFKKILIFFAVMMAVLVLSGIVWFYQTKSDLQTTIAKKQTSEKGNLNIDNEATEPGIIKEGVLDELEETKKREEFIASLEPTPPPVEAEEEIVREEITRPFSFAVIADSESYSEKKYNSELPEIMQKVKEHEPDFVVFTGDIISATKGSQNKRLIQDVKKLIETYFKKYYITFGKHDVECGKVCVELWKEILWNIKPTDEEAKNARLYHSFNYQNSHFAILSSDWPLKHSIDDEQLKWLEEDLKNTTKKNKIVMIHTPPVNFFEQSARKCHDMSCNQKQRLKLMKILEKQKVDLVISGHEHAFDHKIVNGIDFVLAGDTGNSKRYKNSFSDDIYTMIQVSGSNITLKGIRTDGKVMREIEIK